VDEEHQAPGGGARARSRRATPAERREHRAGVEDAAEVMEAAARFLEARPRSVAEVRRKLTGMGYRASLVDAVVVRLEELGYLDDEAFARAWVESRDRSRPRGEHALRQELQRAGVERAVVDEVLTARREQATPGDGRPGVTGDADELAAERLLRRKLGSVLRESDDRRRRQRAYGLLARSGFAPDVCAAVSRRVVEEATLGDEAGEDVEG
jgi:regulatory protein